MLITHFITLFSIIFAEKLKNPAIMRPWSAKLPPSVLALETYARRGATMKPIFNFAFPLSRHPDRQRSRKSYFNCKTVDDCTATLHVGLVVCGACVCRRRSTESDVDQNFANDPWFFTGLTSVSYSAWKWDLHRLTAAKATYEKLRFSMLSLLLLLWSQCSENFKHSNYLHKMHNFAVPLRLIAHNGAATRCLSCVEKCWRVYYHRQSRKAHISNTLWLDEQP